jgi:hypothetical protein
MTSSQPESREDQRHTTGAPSSGNPRRITVGSFLSQITYSLPTNSQGIGNPIDVVKPGRDQGDLQDGAVVEASAAQALVVQRRNFGRVLGEFDHVIDHHSLCCGDRRCCVIVFQRLDESIIQGDPTQKLCV